MTGRGTSARTAVIKLGGRALEDAALRGVFAAELASLAGGGQAGGGQAGGGQAGGGQAGGGQAGGGQAGGGQAGGGLAGGGLAGTWRVIVVHGGGAEVTAMSRRLGHEPRFHEGIRLTTADEMEVVDMVLAGSANKRLVRALSAAGVSAVGICGSDGPTLAAQPEAVPPGTRTGRIDGVDTLLLATLTDAGFVPVVSPVCDDGAGGGINVNADTVAFRVATALDADALLFISDIDGVLKEGTVVRRLDPASADAEIEAGTITDGMIPKIRSSVAAVTAGVGRVHIGDYGAAGALRALLDGARGTLIARRRAEPIEPP